MDKARRKEIKKHNYIQVPLEIYGMWVHFLFDINQVEGKEFLDYMFNQDFVMDRKFNGVTYLANPSHIVIFLPKITWDYESWGTISHEIFHAVTWVADIKPFKLSKDNDEVFAYLIGYITKTFVRKYTRLQKLTQPLPSLQI